MNWQFLAVEGGEDDKGNLEDKPLADMDSMVIGSQMDAIEEDEKAFKLLYMPSFDLTVNLYSSVFTAAGLQGIKVMRRAFENTREVRLRPETTHKAMVS